jgi:hypothetical protein
MMPVGALQQLLGKTFKIMFLKYLDRLFGNVASKGDSYRLHRAGTLATAHGPLNLLINVGLLSFICKIGYM